MRTTLPFLAFALACSPLVPALAQDKLAPPLEAATQPASDRPITAVLNSVAPDAEITKIVAMLSGTFESRPTDSRPALILHASPISITALPNTLLVELARADSPADPFRIYFLHAYRRQGGLRLRSIDLAGGVELRRALAGLWAAPDLCPQQEMANLIPTSEIPLKLESDTFFGTTPHPFPTTRDGAIEMLSAVQIKASSMRMGDAGFDANGKQVWGQPIGTFIEFIRSASAPIIHRDESLVSITTLPAPANASKLEPNGEVVFHYTSWLTTGLVIETSRTPGHEPAKVRIPGNILPGLNKALVGIARGERRKIIVPPELAYGDTGRAPIPPKATLIFDIECLRIDNSPAPQIPTTTINPHAAPNPGAAPPTPADPNAPIGSPPTNGGPETPRGGR